MVPGAKRSGRRARPLGQVLFPAGAGNSTGTDRWAEGLPGMCRANPDTPHLYQALARHVAFFFRTARDKAGSFSEREARAVQKKSGAVGGINFPLSMAVCRFGSRARGREAMSISTQIFFFVCEQIFQEQKK